MTRDGWKLRRSEDRPLFEEIRGFPNVPAARSWLREYQVEPSEVRHSFALRGIPAWKYPKYEVMQRFAECLARGEFIACRRPARRAAQTTVTVPAEAPAFPLSERPVQAPVRQQEMEDNSFPGNADLTAIAAVQQAAAELGLPFCEECARAQRAQQSK